MSLAQDDILVRVDTTPNPFAIKVVANIAFAKDKKVTFTRLKDCEHIPMFKSFFALSGLCQIHAFENQITLSYEQEFSFEDMEKRASEIVKKYGEDHDSNFSVESEKKKKDLSELPEDHRQVEEILNRTIRPYLQADGGDLEVTSVEGNRVNIVYEGACGGCPSAYMGTLESIENILRYELQNDKIEVFPSEY